MPEVVEIRKYADFLKSKMKGKFISKINILNGRYKKHGPFELYKEISKNLPLKVKDIKTKGKFLYIILKNSKNIATADNNTPTFYIFTTLGLSGGWVYKSQSSKTHQSTQSYKFPILIDYVKTDIIDSYRQRSLNHLNVEFQILNNAHKNTGSIFFYDTLSFGTLKGIKSPIELEKKLASIGPDIMNPETTFAIFQKQMSAPSQQEKAIGNVLMNQKIISGIGNYLRADILWYTKISPFTPLKDLTQSQLKAIYKSARILTWADYNRKEGIKLKILAPSDKTPKNYKRDFYVYMQNTNIYGNPVTQTPLYEGSQPRTIHWVEKRQT